MHISKIDTTLCQPMLPIEPDFLELAKASLEHTMTLFARAGEQNALWRNAATAEHCRTLGGAHGALHDALSDLQECMRQDGILWNEGDGE